MSLAMVAKCDKIAEGASTKYVHADGACPKVDKAINFSRGGWMNLRTSREEDPKFRIRENIADELHGRPKTLFHGTVFTQD